MKGVRFNLFNLFDHETAEKDYEYILGYMGQTVLVNGQSRRVLITNTNLENNYDDKKVTSIEPLNRGDIIEYSNGKRFLIVSEQSDKRYYKYKGIARLLPFNIQVNHDCNFIDFPCYIDSPSFGVVDGRVISIATGNIHVHTQDNEQTRQIKVNDRWMKFGQAFKIIGIDPLSRPGIRTFICEKDIISTASDKVDSDLAGWFDCEQEEPEEPTEPEQVHIEIKSTVSDPHIIKSGLTKQYYAEVYDGDILIDDALVSWGLYADDKTSPTNLATITEQTGTHCKVKNNGATSGFVQLRAVLQSDDTVESWLRIEMKSLL